MSLFYKPKFFVPQELISPAIYELCGDDAMYLIHPDMLKVADELRKAFGPMIANTYWNKKLAAKWGYHRFRGLRAKNQKLGAKRSPHKLGINKKDLNPELGVVPYSGIDLWPTLFTAKEIRTVISQEQLKWAGLGITRMETQTLKTVNGKKKWVDIGWLHFDNVPHNKPEPIKFFKG